MKGFSFEFIGANTKDYAWTQHDGYELAGAAWLFHHRAFRLVFIRLHRDACFGAETKVPKLMASRERGQEQFFRIPACRIAPETRI